MLLLLCASCLCAGSGADTARDESTAEHTVPQHDSTAVDTSVAADSSVAADTSVAAPSSAAGSAEAMDVQCPEGIHTGDVVLVRTSGGEEMEVTVPVGIGCERPCEASHRVCTALLSTLCGTRAAPPPFSCSALHVMLRPGDIFTVRLPERAGTPDTPSMPAGTPVVVTCPDGAYYE